jgi:hypothetical protein
MIKIAHYRKHDQIAQLVSDHLTETAGYEG